MKFYIEHNPRQKCWRIYDMRKHKQIEEPPCLMSIGDSMMERYLTALLISNGAIELKDST